MSIPPIILVSWASSLILLVICAGVDLRHRRIPNELVASIAGIGVVQQLVARPGQLWVSLIVLVGVFFGLGILSHHKVIGGGDLKLISAVTLLFPPQQVGQLLLEIALAGGAVSCAYIAARYRLRNLSASSSVLVGPRSGLAMIFRTERDRIAAGSPMPYAVAILGGVCIHLGNEFVPCWRALSCSL